MLTFHTLLLTIQKFIEKENHLSQVILKIWILFQRQMYFETKKLY